LLPLPLVGRLGAFFKKMPATCLCIQNLKNEVEIKMKKKVKVFKLNNNGKFSGHIILPCIFKIGDKYT
jgi:hypothetical protein